MRKKVFVIAEAGINHNGSLMTAKNMVDVALETGADAVKFQTFSAKNLVTRNAPGAEYQRSGTRKNESQFSMLKRVELSAADFVRLADYCAEKKILFLSSPFDEKSADLLYGTGMKIFKIPSGEITNKPLIRHIAGKRRDIILSTGMSCLDEVRKAVAWIRQIWGRAVGKRKLTLLHCVSSYPANPQDVNLKAMNTLQSVFGLPVGYSDHTVGTEIAVAAAAMGAEIIEKHFTLNRNMEGPDHAFSLEPGQLDEMVRAIRNVEKSMGSGLKEAAESEKDIRRLSRRSLVAAKDIKSGKVMRKNDICVKRPGTGIGPEGMDLVIGKRARVSLKKDTIFKRNHFFK